MTQSSPINVSHFDYYFWTYSLRHRRKKEKMREELIEENEVLIWEKEQQLSNFQLLLLLYISCQENNLS